MLLMSCGTVSGQHKSTVAYLSSVPLVIRADSYFDSLGADHQLYLISPAVSVYLLPARLQIEADHYFNPDMPLSVEILKTVEYRAISGGTATGWSALPFIAAPVTEAPFAGMITSRILPEGDSLALEFRRAGTTDILQRTVIYRHTVTPALTSYRSKDHSDSIDNSIKSRKAKAKQLEGFTCFAGKSLELDAGKHVDLLFEKQPVNKDSLMEYRMSPIDHPGDGKWKTTGRLLSMPQLMSNEEYDLEVRYQSQAVATHYTIRTLPHWYQKPLARILFSIAVIYLVAILPYQLYRFKLNAERTKRLRAEQRLRNVQSQLNPHIIFNALNTIDSFVGKGENEKASEYLTHLSDIMRETVKNSKVVFISLAEDMAILDKYLRIEQLRFGFEVDFQVDATLDTNETDFPPMLLQPAVENAVKHGVSNLHEKGKITINYTRYESNLIVTITDNGKLNGSSPHPGTGKGLQYIHDWIGCLRNLNSAVSINFKITPTSTGTTVKFIFQNWLA